MFTGDVVIYDDNLNKNEFTALVSFAVNFRIFHAQLVLPDPSLSLCWRPVVAAGFQARRARESSLQLMEQKGVHTGFSKNLSSLVSEMRWFH